MEFSRLGLTGYDVSRVGFGCAPMGGYDYGEINDADSIRAVRKALDLGINFFDTADVYGFGHAEEVLGKALGKERNRAVIATKFGLKWDNNGRVTRDCSRKRVFEAVEGSLRRLQVDAIDLYQMHWPDLSTPLCETMDALLACQAAGKIIHIGCSNFTIELIDELCKSGKVDSLQASYSMLDRAAEHGILRSCGELGLSFIAHSPLARGFLSGKYGPGHGFEGTDTRNGCPYFAQDDGRKARLVARMREVGARHGKTVSQVAIRWILDNPLVTSAIVGVKNESQLYENTLSADWRLSDSEFKELSSISSACAGYEKV